MRDRSTDPHFKRDYLDPMDGGELDDAIARVDAETVSAIRGGFMALDMSDYFHGATFKDFVEVELKRRDERIDRLMALRHGILDGALNPTTTHSGEMGEKSDG